MKKTNIIISLIVAVLFVIVGFKYFGNKKVVVPNNSKVGVIEYQKAQASIEDPIFINKLQSLGFKDTFFTAWWIVPEHTALVSSSDDKGAEGDTAFYIVDIDSKIISNRLGEAVGTLSDMKISQEFNRLVQLGSKSKGANYVPFISFYDTSGKELYTYIFPDSLNRSQLKIVSNHEATYLRGSLDRKSQYVILFDSNTGKEKVLSNNTPTGITFTFPSLGDRLVEGRTYNITWDGISIDGTYGVFLEDKNHSLIGLSAETGALISDRSITWMIPHLELFGERKVLPGDGFRILIFPKSNYPQEVYYSSVFSITK